MTEISSPLVTVYITSYNYERFIKTAIESLLNQTFQDFECIIIDDGSTDNSKKIIETYSNHPKVKIIFQQNKGLNVTNNIALRVAQGRYIMRLDADDYLDPNALLVMVNTLEKDENLGLVFPDYYMVDVDGNILNLEKRHSFSNDVTLLDQPAHGAVTMIRRKFLLQLGGYDEQFKCQDGYELWIKFTAKFKVTNINTPLFYYRQHGTNLTTNENRILNTRAEIKNKFVKNNLKIDGESIAIIPVRGAKYDPKNIAFIELNNKKILDIKIDTTLEAKKISKIIISSSDNEIEEYIKSKYSNNNRILFHKRPEEYSRFNISLVETVTDILNLENLKNIEINTVVLLAPEYPFINAITIDDAINTIQIFKTDSLISVREETSTFFQHDGKGMKPILNQAKFSKLEREAIYKNIGGIIAFTKKEFFKSNKLTSGIVGHIVVDQKSAIKIQSKLDIEIADFLLKNTQ